MLLISDQVVCGRVKKWKSCLARAALFYWLSTFGRQFGKFKFMFLVLCRTWVTSLTKWSKTDKLPRRCTFSSRTSFSGSLCLYGPIKLQNEFEKRLFWKNIKRHLNRRRAFARRNFNLRTFLTAPIPGHHPPPPPFAGSRAPEVSETDDRGRDTVRPRKRKGKAWWIAPCRGGGARGVCVSDFVTVRVGSADWWGSVRLRRRLVPDSRLWLFDSLMVRMKVNSAPACTSKIRRKLLFMVVLVGRSVWVARKIIV